MPHPKWMTERHIISATIRKLMTQGKTHAEALAQALNEAKQRKEAHLTKKQPRGNVNLRSAQQSD